MRLDSLTGLRAFAALLVFGRHIAYLFEGAEVNFLSPGMVGVSFFYVLSGFVLTWTAKPGDSSWLFFQRRFARVYPAYAVAWLVSMALIVISSESPVWQDLFALTLLQSWFPDEAIYSGANVVFWSISCEAFFYLVFPWIFPLAQRLTQTGRLTVIAACLALVWVAAAINDPLVPGSVGHWFIYFFPPTRMLEFIIGIMLALQIKHGTRRFQVPLWAASLIALAAYMAAAFVPDSYMRVAVTLAPFALLVFAAAQTDLAGKASLYRLPVFVTLGVWSYCFYLIHTQVLAVGWTTLNVAFGFAPEGQPLSVLVPALAGMLFAGVVASAMLHKAVEAPLEKRLRPAQRTLEPASPRG
ncbi:acyltransferase family protein [Arthrobacter mangrovi]|uniref:Acyltransferase n=1 Tax=Arthrobacter mangrovi TaxID=2966350 RepID=A0ABQ5MVB7_9MICC|nr:acyltransferase [Arthrobacter mangrovi]GLB67916.1 acyltransferase [Arthrobacter mangrovi]